MTLYWLVEANRYQKEKYYKNFLTCPSLSRNDNRWTLTGAIPIHELGGWKVTLSPLSVVISTGTGGISNKSFTFSADETTKGKCYNKIKETECL